MGKHQGDGLGMFAVNEFGQLLRVGFLENIEIRDIVAQRFHQPVQHFLGDFGSEGVRSGFSWRSRYRL